MKMPKCVRVWMFKSLQKAYMWCKRGAMETTVVCVQYFTKCFRLTSCNYPRSDNTFISLLYLIEYIYVLLQTGYFLTSSAVSRGIILKGRTWFWVLRPNLSVFLLIMEEKRATICICLSLKEQEGKMIEHLPPTPFCSQKKVSYKMPPWGV